MCATPAPAPPPRDAVPGDGAWQFARALRSRNHRLFFCGQIVSLVGTWMMTTASLWLAYHLASSAMMLGGWGFAGQVPIFSCRRWPGCSWIVLTGVAEETVAN